MQLSRINQGSRKREGITTAAFSIVFARLKLVVTAGGIIHQTLRYAAINFKS